MSHHKNHTRLNFQVKGMHCAACEFVIEKKIKTQDGVLEVNSSAKDNAVTITTNGKKITASELNKLFNDKGYTFESAENKSTSENKQSFESKNSQNLLTIIGTIFLVVIGYFAINKLGLSSLVQVNTSSSLPAFFFFGLIAGTSTCAALVGGVILSMSEKWYELYGKEKTVISQMIPHLTFNTGRILSYALLGGLLGLLGQKLSLSIELGALITFAVAVMMIFLGLQMLGVKGLERFQIRLPKNLIHNATDENKFQGKTMPFIMGALTFFLPCGFTITAQGLALTSGSFVQGSLIMLFFALGTLPMLITIGFSSLKLYQNSKISSSFTMAAGVLVILFALYNINAQMNVLGLPSLNSVSEKKDTNLSSSGNNDLPAIVNGKQVLKMNASAYGYEPNILKVRANVPVVWEVTDTGTSGCTSAIIARDLFSGQIELTPGKISTKEFTPKKTGNYRFSCWMGMITGTIQVVDDSSASLPTDSDTANTLVNNNPTESAPTCGGTGGCNCGQTN